MLHAGWKLVEKGWVAVSVIRRWLLAAPTEVPRGDVSLPGVAEKGEAGQVCGASVLVCKYCRSR